MFGKKKRESEIQSLNQLKGFTWQSVLMGILFVLIGVVLVFNPEGVARTICFTIGAIIAAVGVINIILYFATDFKNNIQQNKLVIGILLSVLGLFFIVGYRIIMSVIPFVMGILIIFNGIVKLQTALNLVKIKAGSWGLSLAIAIITILLGVGIVLNSFGAAKTILRVIGFCLIFSGITDIINVVYLGKKTRNYFKDMEALNQDLKD